MPQSLAKNMIHLIYSTKNRTSCLSPEIRADLHGYKAGILKEWESPALLIGGVADHVHVLFCLSKNHALAKVIEEVKKGSSKWLKTQGPEFRAFHWQAGYGAFSVSQSHVDQVTRYIERQEEHHRTRSFQDEFRAFLKRYGMEYDERYVWD
jgi:putative transposase